jgi:hypothetical protein
MSSLAAAHMATVIGIARFVVRLLLKPVHQLYTHDVKPIWGNP